jgi:demethylmenaquinone methyltransferase / 2-methoxy-6-polyprenyl-1,4-benzoquinol methylase
MPFADSSFDAVISGFGVRNFSNLRNGLNDIYRVLSSGGQLVILEFSKPPASLPASVFNFYFSKILPVIGGWISGNKPAYDYLHQSVQFFPEGSDFVKIMEETGFRQCSYERLTFGISTIYSGYKMT